MTTKQAAQLSTRWDSLVDPVRIKYWFHSVVESSGISIPKELDSHFQLGSLRTDADGRSSYNQRFRRYMNGESRPYKRFREQVNAEYPGTLGDYEHVLWDLLRVGSRPICALRELQRLGPEIQRQVLYRGIELLDDVHGNGSSGPVLDNSQRSSGSALDGVAYYTILLLDQYQETGAVATWVQQLVYLSLLTLSPHLELRGLLDEFLQLYTQRICTQLQTGEISYFLDGDAFRQLYRAKQRIEDTASRLPPAMKAKEPTGLAALTQDGIFINSVFSFDTQLLVSGDEANRIDFEGHRKRTADLAEARGYLVKLAQAIGTVANSISANEPSCIDMPLELQSAVANVAPTRKRQGAEYRAWLAERWRECPSDAFREWQLTRRTSRRASAGKRYSKLSNKLFIAMWGKFLRFLAMLNVSIMDVNSQVIERFLASLEATSRHAGIEMPNKRMREAEMHTKRRHLILLDAVYSHLSKIGVYVNENPCTHAFTYITRPRGMQSPVMISTKHMDEFVRRVLARPLLTWRQIRDCAMLALIPGSGLYARELLDLRMEQIVLDDDPPYINVPAKGRLPARTVPILDFALEPLRCWLAMRRDCIWDTPIVFISGRRDGREEEGRPKRKMGQVALYRKVCAIIEGQGDEEPIFTVGGSGAQVLRNAFLIRQLDKSKPIGAVQLWAGHVRRQSTIRFARLVVNPSGVEAE